MAFSVPKHLIWAIQNNIPKYFLIFHHRGVLYGQKLPGVENKVKKNTTKKGEKWNKKMGGRSFFITSGAFGHGQVYNQQSSEEKV